MNEQKEVKEVKIIYTYKDNSTKELIFDDTTGYFYVMYDNKQNEVELVYAEDTAKQTLIKSNQ